MTRVAPNALAQLTVDREAIAHNYRTLRALTPPGTMVAGVVKADAYGHGIVAVGKTIVREGAEYLAVVNVDEARTLREQGVEVPIMLLMGVSTDDAPLCVGLGFVPVVDRLETLVALSLAASALGRTAFCQLKVDSGMGRLGVTPQMALDLLDEASKMTNLEITGLVSHLATSGGPGDAHAIKQAEVYSSVIKEAREKGHGLPLSSLYATGGIMVPVLNDPSLQGMVRPGIGLYGALADPASEGIAELRGAMTLKAGLHVVKWIPEGGTVSYGCTWTASRPTRIGIIPVGYSDGYPRSASNKGYALFRGARVPIRGRVCMNMIMLDVTDFDPEPQPGEEVVLLGAQGADEITPDELATWAGTIAYEVFCSLGAGCLRS